MPAYSPDFNPIEKMWSKVKQLVEHFHFENALLTRKRQPPQRGVHSGENRVFRLNATFDFHKKSKVICSKRPEGPHP